jgi:hypothetical protein
MLAMLRTLGRSAVSVEAAALRGRGAHVRWVAPDVACASEMGSNFMDRGRRGQVLAAGYRQGLEVGRSED